MTTADLTHLVSWRGPAANEANTDIESTVFATELRVEPRAAAEIAEARWIDPADHGGVTIAPMLELYLFPRLAGAPSA
ncbi:hypothetical protein [Tsukamurella sp. PLM1]|uniref:hypothetical protein n=1 Tax=Tsukamurella sp. PLM1 TaxID=2929795 RepID=UPI0020C15DF1|nr:hypothetical protein [Tsukamurella sp. PLM1]